MSSSRVSRVTGGRRKLPVLADHVRSFTIVSAVMLTFVTNATVFGRPRADSLRYREMSAAAPGLPDQTIGSAYTGRFVPHYLVGVFSDITPLSLNQSYVAALVVVLVALIVALRMLLSPQPLWVFGLCIAILVPSPYFIRPYVADPGSFQDLVFVLGTAVSLLGLLRQHSALVIVGLVLAILGRQSALLTAPVAALWVAVDPAWRAVATRRRWATAIGAIAVVLIVRRAVLAIAAGFTEDFEPHIPDDTVFARLDDLPGALPELVAHGARTFVPLIVALGVVLAGIVVRQRRSIPIPWATWGCLLMTAAIVVQPLAIDPAFPGFASNEQRLSALGLVPLVVAAAVAVPASPRRSVARVVPYAVVALLVLAGLHHTLTRVGPPNVHTFVALQLIIALSLALLIYNLNGRSVPAMGGHSTK